MNNQFDVVREQYYSLRGKYSAGRLTEGEFDAALHDLALQDAQGKYWMIGANSGKWYYFDGAQWVEGDPETADFDTTTEPEPAVQPEPVPAVTKTKTRSFGGDVLLAFIVSACVLVVVAGMAFLVFNGDTSASSGETVATRISPPTAVALVATATPSRAPTGTPAPRAVVQADGEKNVRVGVTPPSLVIDPTQELPGLTTIPTITPGARAGGPEFNDTAFDVSPTSESQAAEPVSEPASAPVSQPGGLPPDVYITNIQVSPNPPHQQQELTFTVSFLNTNQSSVGMEWRVVFFNPAKSGRNKDWGQSQLSGAQVPPGNSQFSLSYIPVTSNGPCVTLQVLVARRLNDGGRFLLPGPGGGPFATMMTFC